MAERIALETYASNIGGVYGAVPGKCCTKIRAEALGCKVSGSYASKRLVPQTALSRVFTLEVVDTTTCLSIVNAEFANMELLGGGGHDMDESIWFSPQNLSWEASCVNYPYAGFPYTVKWYIISNNGVLWSEGYKIVTYNNQNDVQRVSITINLSDVFNSSIPMENYYYLTFEDN